MMKIDGSQGEGGGQIVRTSLSLSAITGTEIEIEKIRAGREKPGLKRQHLTCVRAVAEICGAKVWLMIHSGSRNLGKRIEEYYHKIANRLCTRFRVPLADPDLAFLPIEEESGHHYFTDKLFSGAMFAPIRIG